MIRAMNKVQGLHIYGEGRQRQFLALRIGEGRHAKFLPSLCMLNLPLFQRYKPDPSLQYQQNQANAFSIPWAPLSSRFLAY